MGCSEIPIDIDLVNCVKPIKYRLFKLVSDRKDCVGEYQFDNTFTEQRIQILLRKRKLQIVNQQKLNFAEYNWKEL